MTLETRVVLGLILCGGLVFGFCYEVIQFGEARREGRLSRHHYARFRRRTLGSVVVGLLGAHLLTLDLAEEHLHADPRTLFSWYGVAFILLIWIVQIAVKDFRAELVHALEETRDVTRQSYGEIDEIIRRHRAAKSGSDGVDSKP